MVLKELQPGYMLKGSLLRVARVVVGRYGTDSTEPRAGSDSSEDTTAARVPTVAPPPPKPNEPADGDDSGSTWETDNAGHELEFSEDGFDFSNE
jgi:hypothetical protein